MINEVYYILLCDLFDGFFSKFKIITAEEMLRKHKQVINTKQHFTIEERTEQIDSDRVSSYPFILNTTYPRPTFGQ